MAWRRPLMDGAPFVNNIDSSPRSAPQEVYIILKNSPHRSKITILYSKPPPGQTHMNANNPSDPAALACPVPKDATPAAANEAAAVESLTGMTNPNKRVIAKGMEKESKRAGGGAGKRKLASAPDAADVAIDTTKKAKTDVRWRRRRRGGAPTQRERRGNERRREVEELHRSVDAVQGANTTVVYDTCPEVVEGIKSFLKHDGVTKAMLLRALGNINDNSMRKFLNGKNQDQRANVSYRAGYAFLEKLRILEGRPKSKARLENEAENPDGVRPFSCNTCHPATYFFVSIFVRPIVDEHFLFFAKIIESRSVFRCEGERERYFYGITHVAAHTACRASEKEVGDG